MDSTAVAMEPPAIRGRGAEDLISGLPDELLHAILVRLPSAAAAARTSVLSRRWRGVWAHMPDLIFGGSPAPATTPSTVLDSIDAALDSYAAPTLHSLKIDFSEVDRCHVPAHRISPWLRFASQRVAGKLHLRLHVLNGAERYGDNIEDLALPICERATEIDLEIVGFILRPPPTGSFSLLTELFIKCAQMDGGELGRVVSSPQCPSLQKLHLFVLMKLEPVREVSIRSESLQCFNCFLLSGKLEVTAPMLQEISVCSEPEACIVVAPKLEKVVWPGTYDPGRHQFAVAGRHLQVLFIRKCSTKSSTRLMERFDTVSELIVHLGLQKGVAGYMTFLKEMDKLPMCKTLVVLMANENGHAFAPMMLHLLRRCICIRKFELFLQRTPSEFPSCTMSDCPCHVPENYRLDDITFNSLEEIRISFFTGSAEQVEFVELLLSRCNMVILERVDFMVPSVPVFSDIMEVVQKIRSVCDSNKVHFNVNNREVLKP